VSYSAGFMCTKEQLHRNILVLTDSKKQDCGRCILLVTCFTLCCSLLSGHRHL